MRHYKLRCEGQLAVEPILYSLVEGEGCLETSIYLCDDACGRLGPKYREDQMTKTISIAGTTLELVERGQGRPLLFLHAGEGLAPERSWLEIIPDAGHFPHWEQPEAFAERLSAFIGTNR